MFGRRRRLPDDAEDGGAATMPAGFRGSGEPLFGIGDVVSSSYRVRQLLAADDAAQVLEAWDMVLERSVVLRAAWRGAQQSPLLGEARAAIIHPCAARVFSLGNYKSIDYLVGERIVGETMRERIARDGPLSIEFALVLLRVLVDGLAALHGSDRVAGELDADRVLYTSESRVVLGALSLGQAPATGPAEVLAPEVLRGAAITPLADLYAFGCVAAELLLGRPPLAGDSLKETRFQHVNAVAPRVNEHRSDCPVELGDLVAELLAKEPSERPATAAVVARELEVIAQRVVLARRPARVLIVDGDSDRVRPLWSVIRRADATVIVDAAATPADALTKVRRDEPDLVLVELGAGGGMNGLELCMYLSGVERERTGNIVAITDAVSDVDRPVLEQLVTHVLVRDDSFRDALTSLVRAVRQPRGRARRSSVVSG